MLLACSLAHWPCEAAEAVEAVKHCSLGAEDPLLGVPGRLTSVTRACILYSWPCEAVEVVEQCALDAEDALAKEALRGATGEDNRHRSSTRALCMIG